jgi:hypothetical protein
LLLSPQHFNKYNPSVGAMAPKQSRHDGGADLALRQQLAEIKKVSLEEVGRIRMTPEKMLSLPSSRSSSSSPVALQQR